VPRLLRTTKSSELIRECRRFAVMKNTSRNGALANQLESPAIIVKSKGM